METNFVITIEPEDPELTRRMKLFKRNGAWLSENGGPYYDLYRGQYIAVAGGEVFASADWQEANQMALAKHPGDEPYVQYILKQNRIRI